MQDSRFEPWTSQMFTLNLYLKNPSLLIEYSQKKKKRNNLQKLILILLSLKNNSILFSETTIWYYVNMRCPYYKNNLI